jgi:hypothetical protein
MSKSKTTTAKAASARAAQFLRDSVYDRIVRNAHPKQIYELDRAESLCPSAHTTEGVVFERDARSMAIVMSWKFSFPVTVE